MALVVADFSAKQYQTLIANPGKPESSTVGALIFFFSSRRRHTRCSRDWSSDVCSSDLLYTALGNAANPANINYPVAVIIVAIMVSYVGMVYGPIGAFLAEYFPARIRYRSEERRVGKEGRSRWSPYH